MEKVVGKREETRSVGPDAVVVVVVVVVVVGVVVVVVVVVVGVMVVGGRGDVHARVLK